MIPALNIVAWGNVVPWADQRQIEQDLIISRAIIEIFSDPSLAEALRFRGGTALNKLHFPAPLRYSEDIDLVRTAAGPIGPVLDGIRRVLEPWLGRAAFDQSPVAPKLRFRVGAEDPATTAPIRLKVEIADSDEAGHAFRKEAGHLFRSEAGRDSDFKPATQRLLPRIAAMMFRRDGLVKRGVDFGPAEAVEDVGVGRGRWGGGGQSGRSALSIAP